jgi:hypothetical protein
VAMLGDQPELFGPVAATPSTTTPWPGAPRPGPGRDGTFTPLPRAPGDDSQEGRPGPLPRDFHRVGCAAVKAVFDHPVVQRCQLHKIRNVESKLPKDLASTVAKKMRAAYHDPDALAAEATLEALARSLTNPGAAGSLREGLSETLAVTRLGVPPTLAGRCAPPTPSSRCSRSVVITPPTSSAGARWCCGGARQGCLKRQSSSGGSSASSTCRHFEPPSTIMSRELSHPNAIMRKELLDHWAATEVPRNSGHPLRWRQRGPQAYRPVDVPATPSSTGTSWGLAGRVTGRQPIVGH